MPNKKPLIKRGVFCLQDIKILLFFTHYKFWFNQ